MLSTLFALTLTPALHELSTAPTATSVSHLILDNFNTGEVDFQMPSEATNTAVAVHQVDVLGGIRYTSLTSQPCTLDPLSCSDVRINKRGSGVLSVAHTELVTNAILDLTYDVHISDLREFRISFQMLSQDETSAKNLKIIVVANGVEYPVPNSLSLDFSSLPSPVQVDKLTIRFISVEADDYVIDEINLTRTYTVEPAPVPAFGSIPALGTLAFLGDSADAEHNQLPTLAPAPNDNTEDVPEPSTVLLSIVTGATFLINKLINL